MTKILIFGKQGQIGWELQRFLLPLGKIVILDRSEADLANPESLRPIIRSIQPDIIVNTAAYTAVDKAESEQTLAMTINGIAPGIIAEEADQLKALLIHYSTDYVFDGKLKRPYCEDDSTGPLNYYGVSKLAGEEAIQSVGGKFYIFRTSWVYGIRGKNFLQTVLQLAETKDQLRMVNDQIGAPTWSHSIAAATHDVLYHYLSHTDSMAPSGIYHLSSVGKTSWYGFAEKIVSLRKPATQVIPIPSTEYPTPAKRPKNSLLSNDKLYQHFNITLPHWETALQACLSK